MKGQDERLQLGCGVWQGPDVVNGSWQSNIPLHLLPIYTLRFIVSWKDKIRTCKTELLVLKAVGEVECICPLVFSKLEGRRKAFCNESKTLLQDLLPRTVTCSSLWVRDCWDNTWLQKLVLSGLWCFCSLNLRISFLYSHKKCRKYLGQSQEHRYSGQDADVDATNKAGAGM